MGEGRESGFGLFWLWLAEVSLVGVFTLFFQLDENSLAFK